MKDCVEEIKRVEKNPEAEISRRMTEIRNEIDKREEETKRRIAIKAAEMKKEVDTFEAACLSAFKTTNLEISNEMKNEIKNIENDLAKWKIDLNCFQKNVPTWNSITKKIDAKYDTFRKESERVRRILFGNLFRLNTLELEKMRFCNEFNEPLMYKSKSNSNKIVYQFYFDFNFEFFKVQLIWK